MSGVTREMLLEYIQRKGGRVKNVDLVRHFRKHLLYDDPHKKDQAREVFKETVNSIAYIKQEEGEKFLYLKDEYKKNSPHSSPSKGTPTSAVHNNHNQLMENSSYNANVPTLNESMPQYSVHKPSTNVPVLSSNAYKPPLSVPQKPPVQASVQKPASPYTSSIPYKPSVSSSSVSPKPTPSISPKPMPSVSPKPVVNPSPSVSPKPVVNPSPSVSPKPVVNPSPSVSSKPLGTTSNVQPSPSAYIPPTRPISSAKDILVSHNVVTGSVPTRLQNGGTSYDLEPELKTVSPRHAYNKKPPTGSPSRSANNRFFQNKQYSPSHQTKLSSSPLSSPVFSRNTPLSTSFPTSYTDHTQHGAHNHSPIHQSGGKGHKKMSLEISSPISVHSLSNGTAMAESSDLQQVMSDLENFGKTGVFNDNYSSPYPPNLSDHFSHAPSLLPSSHTQFSENSSLSSNSMHSTSSPPSDQIISPIVKVTSASQSGESQLGVRALIQQYTVPPGAVPSLSPENTGNKAQRSSSSASAHSIGNSDLYLRREHTPPENRVQRSHSNVIRRSKGLEARNSNLGTLTRESIRVSGAHTFHRLSKNSDELVVSNSKEELLTDDQDRDSPIDEYVIEIDPMEREWMSALIDGNIDAIHHMLMGDSSYVNKKGFLHGWTALHWAARLGNAHLIQAIMLSGGKVDIKSGSTPLHLAAEAGYYNIVEMLVNEYNAPVTARDYCGLRPLDVVDTWAPNSIKSILRRGLPNRGLTPLNGALQLPPGTLATLGARHTSKQWGSVPQLSDKEDKKGGTKNVKKGISFRRKKNYEVRKKGKRDSTISEHYEHFDRL